MLDKTLTLASLNARGWGSNSPKQKAIKLWLASLLSPHQILLIQEHHLGKKGLGNTGKGIEFWKGASFWNPGIPMGTSHRTNTGTAILLDKTIAPLVVDSGILVEGRAQFVKLQSTDGITLTVINVYAARTSRERAFLWKAISSVECNSDHTILGGDFNHMVEITRGGPSGYRRMHRREAASWHHMTIQYGLSDAWVSDSFRKMLKKVYTFDNGRFGSGAAVSRIDKYMISQGLESRG
jgi:endonuclease/exonuclease/phosphatase family metal-dependent hydrolase